MISPFILLSHNSGAKVLQKPFSQQDPACRRRRGVRFGRDKKAQLPRGGVISASRGALGHGQPTIFSSRDRIDRVRKKSLEAMLLYRSNVRWEHRLVKNAGKIASPHCFSRERNAKSRSFVLATDEMCPSQRRSARWGERKEETQAKTQV